MKSKNKDKKEKVKREKGGIIHDEGKKRHTLNNERETEQNKFLDIHKCINNKLNYY